MPIPSRIFLAAFVMAASLFFVACSDKTAPVAKTIKLDAELQASYDRSCKHCHEMTATTAPQTGDVEAWAEILDQGMEQTLDRAINGYKGMPPGGQCFECSPEQLEQLIYYMAQPKA